jgi:hypothetical protein
MFEGVSMRTFRSTGLWAVPSIVITLALGYLASGVAFAQEEPSDPAAAAPAAEAPAAEASTPAAEAAPDPSATPGPPAPAAAEAAPEGALATTAPVIDRMSVQGVTVRLESLRARGDRLRARINMLKDAVLRGGRSANASIVHINKMGSQFRLSSLTYTIDGVRVMAQRNTGGELEDKKSISVLSGPIAPGKHTVAVEIVYRGHGYGPFKYLSKQTFEVRGSHIFTAKEGKTVRIEVLGFERADAALPERPSVSFKEAAAE